MGGLLWFGTQDGFRSYDGYQVREFRHDPKNDNSLSGSYINAYFRDRVGMMWIASDNYLDRFDRTLEKFTHYRSDQNGGTVSHIGQDQSGTIWLSTNRGLDRLDPETGKTIRYRHNPNDPSSLGSDFVKSTCQQKDGTFWVATIKSLDVFEPRTGKVIKHIPLRQPGSENSITANTMIQLLEDHQGVLWAAFSSGNGLAVVDTKANKLKPYLLRTFSKSEGFPALTAILEDTNGSLWFGTDSSGLLKLDTKRTHLVRYRHDPRSPESLSADDIRALFQDREGNIWVGTQGGGLNKFSGQPSPFQQYHQEASGYQRLDSEFVTTAYEDSEGILWVGTRKSLNRIDRNKKTVSRYRGGSAPGDISSSFVISMMEDRSGYLWFGTDRGLNRFDRRTKRFTAYRHDPNDSRSLSQDTVLSLFVDHAGRLWVGTEDGLNSFDATSQRFTVYRASPATRNRYRAIAEDSTGALWLATWDTGLQRFDPATGQFTVYRHSPIPGSLTSDEIDAVCVTRAGTIWAGTHAGLNRFDPATKSFTLYDEHDGLPNSNVAGIVEDDQGHLWISTNEGLSHYFPATHTFKNYFNADGLLSNEFYGYNTPTRSRSGEMFFGSYAGMVAFMPDRVVDNPYVPPIVLTDLRIFGNRVEIGGKSPLARSIRYTKNLVLTHKQQIFSLEFSSLSYISPEHNRYRYRLEPLEDRWNETDSSRRTVTYTTLAPGNYKFRVQGTNNRGVWNEQGVTLQIRVLPAFWATWWFRAAVLAAAGLLVWSVYRIRIQNMKRLTAQLEEKVRERTSELLASNRDLESFTYSVSHDLRAPLRHLSGFARILNEEHSHELQGEALDYLQQIERSANHLGELIDHLLSLARFGRKTLTLQSTDLNALVDEVLEILKSEYDRRRVEWKIGRLPTVVCDEVLVQQVYQNLIANALKFTKFRDPAVIEIASIDTAKGKTLMVRDNGVGFDMKYASKLFGVFQRLHRSDQFEGTGIGLATVRRIVQKHGGEIWVESEPEKGATFFFTLATQKAELKKRSTAAG